MNDGAQILGHDLEIYEEVANYIIATQPASMATKLEKSTGIVSNVSSTIFAPTAMNIIRLELVFCRRKRRVIESFSATPTIVISSMKV